MRIFITGASGFIGGAIVQDLKNDHQVVAMSRSEKSDVLIRGLGAEPERGELDSISPESLKGFDAIVHCAAYVKQWGKRADFFRVTVEGTRRLLDAARLAGVKRFVHMSTEASLFYGQDMVNIDETYPYPSSTPFLYSESKAAAEKLVIVANVPGKFETISLRPRLVWGPGDQTVLPVVKQMVEEGRFMWMDGGRARTSTTHITNLVYATRLALTKGNGGQIYFITDDSITTFREFLTALLKSQGMTPPDKSIPGAVARGLATAIELPWKILGIRKEPPLTRFAAAIMSRECTIRIDKAKRGLGYSPKITLEKGLAEMPKI